MKYHWLTNFTSTVVHNHANHANYTNNQGNETWIVVLIQVRARMKNYLADERVKKSLVTAPPPPPGGVNRMHWPLEGYGSTIR